MQKNLIENWHLLVGANSNESVIEKYWNYVETLLEEAANATTKRKNVNLETHG